ncbi:hypothetical protein PIB30_085525 [Stylosanthes scabra]|uniref:Uncharacterized protein n=1 Tax=Stylosanthes scabra TaxID=79078 RepID=A0ABU6QSG2_9FABA|nr:hypothetical protein [Stylosanthes scabra]
MEEIPEVQVEVPTEKSEVVVEIKNQEAIHHPRQSPKKHTKPFSKFLEVFACLKGNIPLLKQLKATSRVLIDMESGELMLRVHDECLILNIYKYMHPFSDIKNCIKFGTSKLSKQKPPDKLLQYPSLCEEPKPITEGTTTKLSKGPTKKHKGGQVKRISETFSQNSLVLHPFVSVSPSYKTYIMADACKKNFDPP